ncbi:hypothetical protein H5410_043804 [Solanum commersonii]|uniref:Late embryogenesis abundant protein LEA-2 subgroup domain-containing protein n=1 Tax=Solanum commersonii TaxID=4109 RepID=A0A9J5XZX2_SOLCO|nr:hypothetical protein H5410_043804 [Solanum commersonii]
MATDQKYPLAPSNIMPRSDAEFATNNFQSNNQRRKKKLRKIGNFWRYDYDSTLATINTAEGTTIGEFVIPDGEVRRRSTKKVYVMENIILPSRLNNTSGILPVISEAKMRGKVKVFMVFRWKKNVDLNCTMSINLTISAIQDLDCQC